MPICKLCHKNEADKKGSHLVPHFLMKKIDNVEGKPGRDLELGFELGAAVVKGYFGRSVQPEKLDEVYGNRSDEENANSRSILIVDNFLCSHCEKRLSVLESDYSASLNKYELTVYLSTESALSALLFWISIFWRMSACESIGFKLNEIDEHHLRIILDGGLDAEDAATYIAKLGKDVTGISYRLMRSKDFTKDHNGFLFFGPDQQNPYCALIGEFAVFLSVDKPVEFSNDEAFLGLEKLLTDATLNTCEIGEFVLPVDAGRFDESVEAIVQFYVIEYTGELNIKLDALHQKFIGKGSMDLNIKKEIIAELSSDFNPLGRRYTTEAIIAAATKVLVKYEPYRSIGQV